MRVLVCLEVAPDPHGRGPGRRLAAALKAMWRRERLRCVWLADPAQGRGRWNPTMWTPGEGI